MWQHFSFSSFLFYYFSDHKPSLKVWTTIYCICRHYVCSVVSGQLCPRGRASVLLLDGCWFDSPGLHVKVSLFKILNPKLLLMCWSALCMAATAISVCVYVWITVSGFALKVSAKLKYIQLYLSSWISPVLDDITFPVSGQISPTFMMHFLFYFFFVARFLKSILLFYQILVSDATSCKHNSEILWLHDVTMANKLVNLLTHPADTEQRY